MNYDTIILELLSRIKSLEDDVSELKQIISTPSSQQQTISTNNTETIDCDNQTKSTVSYKKTTDEMIDICYKCGKMLKDGESIQDLADSIVESTDMNRNSAIMYLYAVQGMLEGTVYKRAISANATRIFFNNIFNDYGSAGLRKAISSARQHIQYRHNCGLPYESIEEICNTYESRL